MFGIEVTFSSGKLAGLKCAAMRHWGLPKLFPTPQEAGKYARLYYGPPEKSTQWEIVSARIAQLRCQQMVEYINGRRDRTGNIIDPRRMSYEQILPFLERWAETWEREQQWLRDKVKPMERRYTMMDLFPEENHATT